MEYEIVLVYKYGMWSKKQINMLSRILESQDIKPAYLVSTAELGTVLELFADGIYSLEHSYGITTNIEIHRILSSNNISILETDTGNKVFWRDVFDALKPVSRKVKTERKTRETNIVVELNLDGRGRSFIQTGLGFFDHMLDQIAGHSGVDLSVNVEGDLHIDEHHTIEDTALALGEALSMALGKKTGIERYGFFLPMDDSVCRVALDFSGRPQLVWKVQFNREKLGDVPTELFEHFFKSLTDTAKCNLYIEAEGENEHHKIEAVFKGFARALKMAIRKNYENHKIPSTKGSL
jgi:imidazoleglycerol-phosphate dehydratase/histidinol-phosphatase